MIGSCDPPLPVALPAVNLVRKVEVPVMVQPDLATAVAVGAPPRSGIELIVEPPDKLALVFLEIVTYAIPPAHTSTRAIFTGKETAKTPIDKAVVPNVQGYPAPYAVIYTALIKRGTFSAARQERAHSCKRG